LMLSLARQAARALKDYDAGILEIHHTRKKDSPSGTALRLAEAVRQGRPGDVQISAQRLGDVVGEHALIFAGPDERLSLSHSAQSRDVFARGALDAAAWVARKKPGLYDMLDLMGLER
jgi:4-hydroxy-tetrahydrodipicolinate reductase